MMTSYDVQIFELVRVVTYAIEVSIVYCGGVHLFVECSTNHVYVNYVGNKKYNNSCMNTYNPRYVIIETSHGETPKIN